MDLNQIIKKTFLIEEKPSKFNISKLFTYPSEAALEIELIYIAIY